MYSYTIETRQWINIGVLHALIVHCNDSSVEFLKDNVYLDRGSTRLQLVSTEPKIHNGVLPKKLSFLYYSNTNHFEIWRLEEFEMEEN